MSCNRVDLSGKVIEIDALRHTPAGLPVLAFKISHASEQQEACAKRQVQCEASVMVIGKLVETVAGLEIGNLVSIEGFLSRRSLNNPQLILHANRITLMNLI